MVGAAASFAFAYYWPEQPRFSPTTNGSAVLFQVDSPIGSDVVVTSRWRDQAVADRTLRAGLAMAGSHRVWLVLAEAGDGGPYWPRLTPVSAVWGT